MSIKAEFNRQALLSAERGFVPLRKSGTPLRVALVYPNTYHIGMSSLGFQIAWRVINDHPRATAERFFTDTLQFGSIESGTPLSRFDVIAFSGAYEMDDPNVLDVLESAGLPLLAKDRGDDHPLIAAGGVLISVNRMPIYPFMDVFFHGDAEVVLPKFLDAICEDNINGRRRLESIDGLPGIEITAGAQIASGISTDEGRAAVLARVPEIGQTYLLPFVSAPEKLTLEDLDRPPCSTQTLTPHTEFSDMALIDLARGCPHHCTFCWIGHNTPPYRQRSLETIIRAIEDWASHTDRIGLVASAVGAHTQIDDVCKWIMKRGLRVSYSSLRVEEVTPIMLEALAKGGQKTITIAPEAGNMRVRRLLGKKISDDQILEVVDHAMSLGTENIKLYYMTGIPSETDHEAMDIVRFSLRIRERMLKWARPRGRVGYLGFNLGIFVPKPNLPLNHIEPTPFRDVKRRLKKLVQELQKIPNTKLNVASPDLALAQSVLSTGGLEASRYITLLRERGGDWRRTNREWIHEAEEHFERQMKLSRLDAEKIRRHAVASLT